MGIEFEMKQTVRRVAHYIAVDAEVRYWEDATVNGEEDTDGDLIPCRMDDSWMPVIRLEDGRVERWPEGTTAKVHYKVCDAGQYWLLDADHVRIAKYRSHYVPNEFLCPGEQGFGDYIIMTIGADGVVEGWRTPSVNVDDWEAV